MQLYATLDPRAIIKSYGRARVRTLFTISQTYAFQQELPFPERREYVAEEPNPFDTVHGEVSWGVYGMKSLVLLEGLAILLAVTNPSRDDFREWLHQEISTEMRQSRYGEAVDVAALVGIDASSYVVNYMMRGVTKRDYVMFSIYTLHIDNRVERFLGVGKHFLPLAT